MFTTRLNWAASFHCAVIHSADIPGKKKSIGILQSIASFSWLLLPHPTRAVIWREREIERESLWLTDVGQNQNATQILTWLLHQGKRCSPGQELHS